MDLGERDASVRRRPVAIGGSEYIPHASAASLPAATSSPARSGDPGHGRAAQGRRVDHLSSGASKTSSFSFAAPIGCKL